MQTHAARLVLLGSLVSCGGAAPPIAPVDRTWLGKVENANGGAELDRVGDGLVAAVREAGRPSCFFPSVVKELAATSPR